MIFCNQNGVPPMRLHRPQTLALALLLLGVRFKLNKPRMLSLPACSSRQERTRLPLTQHRQQLGQRHRKASRQDHSRQCRAFLARLLLALQPQKAGHHLAHLPHQAARRTPGRLPLALSSAVLVVDSLGVSLVRPSAATLAGRLAVLLAASAAAISAA